MEHALEEWRHNCYRKTQPSRLKHRSRGKLEEEEGRRPKPRGVVLQLHCSAAPSAQLGGRHSRPPPLYPTTSVRTAQDALTAQSALFPPCPSLPRRVRWPPGDDKRGTRQ